jgi:NADPH2:quinone reductase
MRAVVVRQFGAPQALELIDAAVPEPGPGQIRIRVAAAAVNPVDLAVRSGLFSEPGIAGTAGQAGLGWDVAGVIDRAGPGVTGLAAGDAVIGLSDRLDVAVGGYAEQIVLDASAVARAPAGIDLVQAATLTPSPPCRASTRSACPRARPSWSPARPGAWAAT